MLRPIVQQLSHRRVRRLLVRRTASLNLAPRSVVLQQRAMTCLVHRPLQRRPVRRVQRTRPGRQRTLLGMKARLVRKTLHVQKPRLARRLLRVRRMHRIRRPRLAKQHPFPRTRHMLKPKLVRRLLPDRRLKPIQRRKKLVRKNGENSSAARVSTIDGS